MALVTISFFGTLIWDRIVLAIFAPEIFKAMLSEVCMLCVSGVIHCC